MTVRTRASGSANSQVAYQVKAALADWLRSRGVGDAHRDISDSAVLFTHYQGGDYVAISNRGVSDVEAFNEAYTEAVDSYWRNEAVHDDCFWVHREWIAKQMGLSQGDTQDSDSPTAHS